MLNKYQVRECLMESSHSQTMVSVSESCIYIALEMFPNTTDPDLPKSILQIPIQNNTKSVGKYSQIVI